MDSNESRYRRLFVVACNQVSLQSDPFWDVSFVIQSTHIICFCKRNAIQQFYRICNQTNEGNHPYSISK